MSNEETRRKGFYCGLRQNQVLLVLKKTLFGKKTVSVSISRKYVLFSFLFCNESGHIFALVDYHTYFLDHQQASAKKKQIFLEKKKKKKKKKQHVHHSFCFVCLFVCLCACVRQCVATERYPDHYIDMSNIYIKPAFVFGEDRSTDNRVNLPSGKYGSLPTLYFKYQSLVLKSSPLGNP